MIITCPMCRGAGHVESYPCQCNGWGRLKVSILGPCDSAGNIKSTNLEDDPDVRARLAAIVREI